MKKELSKATMNNSRVKNKYTEWPTWEDFVNLNKIKNWRNSTSKTAKK